MYSQKKKQKHKKTQKNNKRKPKKNNKRKDNKHFLCCEAMKVSDVVFFM